MTKTCLNCKHLSAPDSTRNFHLCNAPFIVPAAVYHYSQRPVSINEPFENCPLWKPIDDQPAPVPNDRTPIWDLVIADMRERDQTGRATYGTPLQAFNGRDALMDAYQEALDLAAYLKQELEQRKEREQKG